MYRNSDPEQLYEPSTVPSGLEEADHRLLMRGWGAYGKTHSQPFNVVLPDFPKRLSF